MKKNIYLLGSTGSIGKTTLNVIEKDKQSFVIKLLTTNNNVRKLYAQALEFGVNKVVIFNKKKYTKYSEKFRKNKISVFFSIDEAFKNNKTKSFLTINAISGIDGLEPSLKIIKHSENLAIANKESIICGWNFLKNELIKYKTGFIPLDSEHFSIWSLLKNEKKDQIKKIYLTASGGPFLFKKLENIKNIKSKFALKHPNWSMGKKISIDSATMMNKIFEVIEAMKIFNLERNKIDILIHPKSYLHAIVNFNNGLTKLLAHDTTMEIPITNALYLDKEIDNFKNNNFEYNKLNGLNFLKPDKKNFHLLKVLNNKFHDTYLEVILVSINDELVQRYLDDKLSYLSIHKNMLKLLKKPYFTKYYSSRPKNINDVKLMVNKVKDYLNEYLK